MIQALAHVCFVVRDLDASIGFYCNKLGMKPAFDFVNDEGRRFGIYIGAGGRSFIELFAGNPAPQAERQSFQHICLEVDDLNKTVAGLRAAGVEVTDPFFACDNAWQAWITDPDGNKIELHYYTPESKQTACIGKTMNAAQNPRT